MLRASVKTDKATRAVEMELTAEGSAWDTYDMTATWRATDKRRWFRPDHARIVMTLGDDGAWRMTSISVSGQLILKSGQPSPNYQSRDKMTWTSRGYREAEKLTGAPAWIKELASQVPIGITAAARDFVMTEWPAEEVQAL